MNDQKDIRWQQRFQNFDRAVVLLREPVERGLKSLSALEKEGTVQRFEFALELAWKTLKDYMAHEGRVLDPATPRNTIKEAFAIGILKDGQVWIDMLEHRNLLSHTYDPAVFDRTMEMLEKRYFGAIEELHGWLLARRVDG